MESLAVNAPGVAHETRGVEIRTSVPFYLYATVLSSLSIIVGLVWDISWHMSIGRDGLFSPPHLAIYLGGVTAGIFSAYRVLKITIKGTAFERSKTVKFWGVFHGSLGNLFCIWGAIAMLTSAPFDDWWHNTYGLDVTILSPPHTVLLLGMISIQLGAMVSVLGYQNLNAAHVLHDAVTPRGFQLLFALSGGFLLCMVYTVASEYLGRHDMHAASFYVVASLLFPLFLVAFSVASKSPWGATQTTLVYTALMMLMVWILPLFPASPLLGPVLNPVTHFQPFDFPLLILFPAMAIDWIVHRTNHYNGWLRAIFTATAFLVLLFALQWPFGDVLMASRGHWFFGTSQWYFASDPNWPYRYAYSQDMVDAGATLWKGLLIALLVGYLSSRIAITWGQWMKKIVR